MTLYRDAPVPPEVMDQYRAYRAAFDSKAVDDSGLLGLPAVIAAIRTAIVEGRALSMVRLGDGEGGCLFWGTPGYAALGDYVSANCMWSHFGPQDWTRADFDFLQRDVARAALGADIVTFARKAHVRQRILNDPNPEIRSHVGATYADYWLSDHRADLRGRVYQDCYLHAKLLPHYPALLAGTDIVVVGSLGAAFAERLAQAFGARLAEVLEIPGQWRNGAQGAVRLYPHALPDLRARLVQVARPGRVVLVAAGLCGKGLCVDAAASGAVALDLGSIMDVLAGRGVRVYQDAEMVAKYAI